MTQVDPLEYPLLRYRTEKTESGKQAWLDWMKRWEPEAYEIALKESVTHDQS